MSLPFRCSAVGLGLAGVILLGSLPLAAQQETPAKGSEKTGKAVRKPVDPNRRVPDYFADLGLSDEQREAMYKIRAQHQSKLEELKKEMAATNARIVEECEALLNAPQKELLAARRKVAEEAARVRRAAARKKAAEKKAASAISPRENSTSK